MEDTTKLNTSKLGTKQYWDDFYALERQNFRENPEDTGECWFDDSNGEMKMVEFLSDNIGQHSIKQDSSVLDMGTGNGHLLFELIENDFTGKMYGVDYSQESVTFAQEIAKEKGLDDGIVFSQADIFDTAWNPGEFDIVLDKGTLDAVALSGFKVDGDRPITEVYNKVIEKLLKKGGVFLITSCNFTQDELIKIIENDKLKFWHSIHYPVLEFGGVKGSTICSVAFIKE
ncbi:hypothetical protein KAFR_0B01380 [Kazachstania africana CBS 2517]|uniref:Protein-lysine N-methyltransferase EFM4 n=1 Tax=Kazachstania africana (strain ATCC 22294 / BCRC 22015 / CBS 2517 / CECT 1963 / NBRC 1671 / NRRL Y-8276) TaxID=1071382 RepID=H2APY7_KAZAF|nr:hypothetical protein KAFR_0B01380 [Kazachstania africana CBS 2517]CCF56437.1 hypothetical protein KAFR_0B01380 [Kazachstania africana CBS 2517]